jgi:hypothetical protein
LRSAAIRFSNWRSGLLTLVIMASPALLTGQSLTVRAVGDALHVRAAALGLIEGQVSDSLRDGRSVRVDFELTVLERPEGPSVTQGRHGFNLSFDLWEQRFAVTRIGTPPRSVSHLTSKDAEAWCLENVTLPLIALGRFGREAPFWVRLQYRVQGLVPASASDDDAAFTLRKLIDVLSRRRQEDEWGKLMEAGPFRLSNQPGARP